jgi:hypothetical protein
MPASVFITPGERISNILKPSGTGMIVHDTRYLKEQ